MHSKSDAMPTAGLPGELSSGLRQWVELDPTNGAADPEPGDGADEAASGAKGSSTGGIHALKAT